MNALRAIVLAFALVLSAAPASAEPVTLLSYLASALYTAGYYYAAAAVVAVAIAVSVNQQNRAKRSANDAYNASLKDRMVTVRGATEPRRMVLGRQRVGGVVAFVASTGANKEKFVMVVALAAHECDAIEDIYFDGVKVDFEGEFVTTEPFQRTDLLSVNDAHVGNGATVSFTASETPIPGTVHAVQPGGTGDSAQGDTVFGVDSVVGTTVTLAGPPTGDFSITYQTGKITRYARVRKFLGGPGQTVDAAVQALFPLEWNAVHPMSGCAGLAIFFDYNEDAFQSPVDVSAIVRGAKCYDPRKDTTAGGSGAHRWGVPATYEWSDNAALAAYDRLRDAGYPAMIDPRGRGAATVYRVRLGGLPSREDAEVLAKRIGAEFDLKGATVSR